MATSETLAIKGSGNTDRARPEGKFWIFVWNNYELATGYADIIKSFALDYCEYLHYQKECGVQGTNHLQGFFKLISKKRLTGLKNLLNDKIHFQQMKGTIQQNMKYCSKESSKTGDGFSHPNNLLEILNKKRNKKELHEDMRQRIISTLPVMDKPWQIELLNMLKLKPDDRKIIYIYETVGNVGKTTFAKYLCINIFNEDCIYIVGSSSDMKHAVACFHDKYNKLPKLLIIDLPRSKIEADWGGVEQLKNALFFSEKYESRMIYGEIPHFIIFSNHMVNTHKLSIDRWMIGEIIENSIKWM